MPSRRDSNSRWPFALVAALLAVAGCSDPQPAQSVDKPKLGLLTSLPILWSGSDAFAALATGDDNAAHWMVGTIERDYVLDPLDTLTDESLAPIDLLVLAQPRILTPQENVALDDWVRGGGHILIFADPQLAGDSDFPLGDPRRPLDTALLSPILDRWGLVLVHDLDRETVRTVTLGDADMAVVAAGKFETSVAEGAACATRFEQILAECMVGEGRAVLLADATLVEDRVGGPGSPAALRALLGMAREEVRENAGETRK
ncbi:Gldg family protein [Parerythrobacter aestuarii]|uniref:Gldg family protein n=1 Tax=Parerythrobacter aestuarii TaxID=3020909 RepID=UPI0024DEDEA3|nr:hypothetical protein [Parerythrobacter aestuarii]